jgi:hypothetical protein
MAHRVLFACEPTLGKGVTIVTPSATLAIVLLSVVTTGE